MFWFLFCLILGSTIATIYLIWRKWIKPWRDIEHLIKLIGRGERPNAFVIDGGRRAQRVGIALEDLFSQRRRLDRKLVEQASGEKAIFAAMQDGLLVVDAERRITLFNRTFQELFGVRDESLGAPFLETVRDASVGEVIQETFRTEGPVQREITIADRHLQMNSVPMGSDNGKIAGAVVLFHDISDLKRGDQMRRDFVANVSHELRTPLSILRGYIETLLDDPKTSPQELSRILKVMESHSKRLGSLVEDLLTLARLESGKPNLRATDVDLAKLSAEVIQDWQKRFANKQLKVIVDVPGRLPVIRADETSFREVLDNLLDNALKYSREHGEVRLQAEQRANEIALSVSDTGVGISNEHLPRIFERFYRAEQARSGELGGTGLGLSIVKHIAQLHGGRVEAESEPGQGTTIRVVIPIVTQT